MKSLLQFIENSKFILFITLSAAGARFWDIGNTAFFFDEYLHIPTAFNYMEKGQLWPDLWYHPPLKHILLYGSMKIFGNNPYGWRMRNFLFAMLSIPILYLLGKIVFDDEKVAVLSSLLMAVEPMHIFTSRTASEEIPATFFCLCGVYAAIRHLRGEKYWIITCGLFFGLAVATKWYFQIAMLGLLIIAATDAARAGKLRTSSSFYISASLLILPATIYLLTFLPWFSRGYGIYEFLQMQIGAYKTIQSVTMTGFLADSMFASDWFIKPIVLIRVLSPDWSSYDAYMSNFPFWMLTIPAAIHLLFRLREKFDVALFLVFIVWASMYIPMLLIKRPVLLYSSLPMLPLAYLMVSFLIMTMLKKMRSGRTYFRILIIAVYCWGAYLWPLVVRLPVPAILYEPLRLLGK